MTETETSALDAGSDPETIPQAVGRALYENFKAIHQFDDLPTWKELGETARARYEENAEVVIQAFLPAMSLKGWNMWPDALVDLAAAERDEPPTFDWRTL